MTSLTIGHFGNWQYPALETRIRERASLSRLCGSREQDPNGWICWSTDN